MKLTSQEEYGLRCILSLARRQAEVADPVAHAGGKQALTVGQISETEGISPEYVGKLLGIMGRGGLVESVRGRHGGYRLARPAGQISVSEALAALGDKFYKTETCDRFSGDQTFCVHSTMCSIRSLWSGLQLLLDHVLQRTTLQDLVTLGERNVADWMKSHLEAVSDLGPLSDAPVLAHDAASDESAAFNVVLRSEGN